MGQMLVFSGLQLTSKNANTAKIRNCTENDFCDIWSIVSCCGYFKHYFYSQVTLDCNVNEESEKDNLQDNLAPVMNDINMTKKAPNKIREEKIFMLYSEIQRKIMVVNGTCII